MSDIDFEVIVSRIKLRMRKNPNPNPNPNPKPTTGNFNFHFHGKLLTTDDDHIIISERDYPKQLYTASIHNPFPFYTTQITITSALSKITDLDPEFRPIITSHVIAFARRCRYRNPKFAIDVDIKKVSGSFTVAGECMHDWVHFEEGHLKMTRGWIDDDDDKDYNFVKNLEIMSSYVKVPCELGRGDLKAVSYRSDEVTQIGTCAICLVDFEPDEEATMNVLKMPCGHVFHRECIVSWIRSNCDCETTPTCPLCRATLQFLKDS